MWVLVVVLLVALMIPITAILLDSPLGRSIARRLEAQGDGGGAGSGGGGGGGAGGRWGRGGGRLDRTSGAWTGPSAGWRGGRRLSNGFLEDPGRKRGRPCRAKGR